MHLPWWFPGASFKKEAAKWAPHIDEMVNKPYQTVKDALVRQFCLFHDSMVRLTVAHGPGTGRCSAVCCSFHDHQPSR